MPTKTDTISQEQPQSKANEKKEHLKTAALNAYGGQEKSLISDEQIVDFLPMVNKIVQRVVTYLKPPLSFEDLVSAGTIGLVKAAHDFNPTHNAEFQTYAYIRVKGAVIDELRKWSFVPANLNQQIRSVLKISREITETTGYAPTDEQLARKAGITIDELYKMFENERARNFISIDGTNENVPSLASTLKSSGATSPDEQIEQTELVEKLAETIQQLPKKQKQIILLYYQQHLTMKQVAEVLKVTESRISQLHASAIFNLSIKLRQWKNDK